MQIDLFKLETIEGLVLYSLIFVILILIIKYLIFRQDIESKGVAKFIGGLTVFVIALLSQNPFVIFASLFIGGLIIASEEFMEKLAIILRSESKDIGINLKPVTPTQQEVKEKKQLEIHETKEIQQGLIKSQVIKPLLNSKQTTAYLLKNTLHGEKAAAAYLKNKYRERFSEDIKFETPIGKTILVDGVISNEQNNAPEWIVEIRVLKEFGAATALIARTVDKVRSVIQDLPLLICFVFTDTIRDQEVKILKEFIKNFNETQIAIFVIKNETIKPIIDTTF
ncbi:hypothetical protein BH11PAT1_BH11PAT1_4220 [soil metagenome]